MAQCALKPLLSGFFLSLILLASTQMAQAERCRAIKIEGDQKIDDVQIDFSLISGDQSMSSTDSQAFSVTDGSDIDLCFQSNKTGLLSLWSYSADGSAPSRLLPHELTTVGAYEPGLKVEAGKRYCLSELLVPNRKIAIKVRPPPLDVRKHIFTLPKKLNNNLALKIFQ